MSAMRARICPTVPQGLFAVAAISVSTLTFVLMTVDVWVSVTSAKHCQYINIVQNRFSNSPGVPAASMSRCRWSREEDAHMDGGKEASSNCTAADGNLLTAPGMACYHFDEHDAPVPKKGYYASAPVEHGLAQAGIHSFVYIYVRRNPELLGKVRTVERDPLREAAQDGGLPLQSLQLQEQYSIDNWISNKTLVHGGCCDGNIEPVLWRHVQRLRSWAQQRLNRAPTNAPANSVGPSTIDQCKQWFLNDNTGHGFPLSAPTYQRVVSISGSLWASAFHHVVAESMVGLACYESCNPSMLRELQRENGTSTLKLHVYARTAFVDEWLEMAGIVLSNVVDGLVKAERLWVPYLPPCGGMDGNTARAYRQLVTTTKLRGSRFHRQHLQRTCSGPPRQ